MRSSFTRGEQVKWEWGVLPCCGGFCHDIFWATIGFFWFSWNLWRDCYEWPLWQQILSSLENRVQVTVSWLRQFRDFCSAATFLHLHRSWAPLWRTGKKDGGDVPRTGGKKNNTVTGEGARGSEPRWVGIMIKNRRIQCVRRRQVSVSGTVVDECRACVYYVGKKDLNFDNWSWGCIYYVSVFILRVSAINIRDSGWVMLIHSIPYCSWETSIRKYCIELTVLTVLQKTIIFIHCQVLPL